MKMKILKVMGIIVAILVVLVFVGGLYVKSALPNTGNPENITIKVTQKRIERGKYLAMHVAVCMDCHSKRNWNLFAGPMVNGSLGSGGEKFDEKMGFPGTIYARNITPNQLTNWSDGEILRAVTTGESKDGSALFPLMAYSRYGKMDREDIYSIIAYLRSIDPIANQVPAKELDFPVNLINNTLPKKADFHKIPVETDTVNYGGYLVNVAGCVDCHSKTDKGSVIPGTEFGGGMEFKYPNGTVTSANITMDKNNGIGNWTKEAFVARFKIFADSLYRPAKVGITASNTPMPWVMYAGMKNTDLEAIFAYLKSLKPQSNHVTIRKFN